MPLDLDSLRKSILALERSLQAAGGDLSPLDEALKDAVSAGLIQQFEVAYEMAWKHMKRWIEMHVGSAQVDGVTRRELFRQAAEQRLITDVEAWMDHHHARNLTSHTYNAATAEEVLEDVPRFLHHALALLAALEARND